MRPPLEVISFQATAHPIQLMPTRSFTREALDIFTQEEREGFLNYIAANPDAGAKIPGTSGLRKIRWKAKGSGKRGGARIIYYFRDLNMPLLLITAYPKNHVARLSEKRMRQISQMVEQIVERLTWPDDIASDQRA